MIFVVFIWQIPVYQRSRLRSSQKTLPVEIPQGSLSSPILFILYTQPLSNIISQSRCSLHKFADDIHLHQSSTPSDFHTLNRNIAQCVDSVGRWMSCNRLNLNNDKTEALVVWFRRRVSMSQNDHFRVCAHDISVRSHAKKAPYLHWRYLVYGEAYWPH